MLIYMLENPLAITIEPYSQPFPSGFLSFACLPLTYVARFVLISLLDLFSHLHVILGLPLFFAHLLIQVSMAFSSFLLYLFHMPLPSWFSITLLSIHAILILSLMYLFFIIAHLSFKCIFTIELSSLPWSCYSETLFELQRVILIVQDDSVWDKFGSVSSWTTQFQTIQWTMLMHARILFGFGYWQCMINEFFFNINEQTLFHLWGLYMGIRCGLAGVALRLKLWEVCWVHYNICWDICLLSSHETFIYHNQLQWMISDSILL